MVLAQVVPEILRKTIGGHNAPPAPILIRVKCATVHLLVPMNHYAKDTCVESDVPIMATSICPIRRKGMNNEGELTIMDARRNMFLNVVLVLPSSFLQDWTILCNVVN